MNKILLVAILALVVVPNQSFASDYEEGSDEYSQEGSQFEEKQLNSSKEKEKEKEKEEAEEEKPKDEEKPVIRAR